jgi:hypothetical protein
MNAKAATATSADVVSGGAAGIGIGSHSPINYCCTSCGQTHSADSSPWFCCLQDAPCAPGTPIKKQQQIRLQHGSTRKWLHSHHFYSPMSGNQEVSPAAACQEAGRLTFAHGAAFEAARSSSSIRHGPRPVCRWACCHPQPCQQTAQYSIIMALREGRGFFCSLHWLPCLCVSCSRGGMGLGLCGSADMHVPHFGMPADL